MGRPGIVGAFVNNIAERIEARRDARAERSHGDSGAQTMNVTSCGDLRSQTQRAIRSCACPNNPGATTVTSGFTNAQPTGIIVSSSSVAYNAAPAQPDPTIRIDNRYDRSTVAEVTIGGIKASLKDGRIIATIDLSPEQAEGKLSYNFSRADNTKTGNVETNLKGLVQHHQYDTDLKLDEVKAGTQDQLKIEALNNKVDSVTIKLDGGREITISRAEILRAASSTPAASGLTSTPASTPTPAASVTPALPSAPPASSSATAPVVPGPGASTSSPSDKPTATAAEVSNGTTLPWAGSPTAPSLGITPPASASPAPSVPSSSLLPTGSLPPVASPDASPAPGSPPTLIPPTLPGPFSVPLLTPPLPLLSPGPSTAAQKLFEHVSLKSHEESYGDDGETITTYSLTNVKEAQDCIQTAKQHGGYDNLKTSFRNLVSDDLEEYIFKQAAKTKSPSDAYRIICGPRVADGLAAIYHEAYGKSDPQTLTGILKAFTAQERATLQEAWDKPESFYKRQYGKAFNEMLNYELAQGAKEFTANSLALPNPAQPIEAEAINDLKNTLYTVWERTPVCSSQFSRALGQVDILLQSHPFDDIDREYVEAFPGQSLKDLLYEKANKCGRPTEEVIRRVEGPVAVSGVEAIINEARGMWSSPETLKHIMTAYELYLPEIKKLWEKGYGRKYDSSGKMTFEDMIDYELTGFPADAARFKKSLAQPTLTPTSLPE